VIAWHDRDATAKRLYVERLVAHGLSLRRDPELADIDYARDLVARLIEMHKPSQKPYAFTLIACSLVAALFTFAVTLSACLLLR
jgi:hypothetical protein